MAKKDINYRSYLDIILDHISESKRDILMEWIFSSKRYPLKFRDLDLDDIDCIELELKMEREWDFKIPGNLTPNHDVLDFWRYLEQL